MTAIYVSGRSLLAFAPEEERKSLVKEFGKLTKGFWWLDGYGDSGINRRPIGRQETDRVA